VHSPRFGALSLFCTVYHGDIHLRNIGGSVEGGASKETAREMAAKIGERADERYVAGRGNEDDGAKEKQRSERAKCHESIMYQYRNSVKKME